VPARRGAGRKRPRGGATRIPDRPSDTTPSSRPNDRQPAVPVDRPFPRKQQRRAGSFRETFFPRVAQLCSPQPRVSRCAGCESHVDHQDVIVHAGRICSAHNWGAGSQRESSAITSRRGRRSPQPAADDRFARPDAAELTIELATSGHSTGPGDRRGERSDSSTPSAADAFGSGERLLMHRTRTASRTASPATGPAILGWESESRQARLPASLRSGSGR
jgi:hypothetical protein